MSGATDRGSGLNGLYAGSDTVAQANQRAWEAERYEAWTAALGPPAVEAGRIVADPRHTLRRLWPHLGEVSGRRVCSVQGSNGRMAVALAVLGARATVLDFSEPNQRYALELAKAAGVDLGYRLGDVMGAREQGLVFDLIVMELGILHYHQDLAAFFAVMAGLAAPGARMVLNEFHPVQRKLFQGHGASAEPDYFSSELVVADVPDPTGLGRSLGQCAYRFWTLGEVVGAVLGAGFRLVALEEHPDWEDPKIPGTFTLVAET